MEKIKDIAERQTERMSRFFKTDAAYVAKSSFWMNGNFAVSSIFGLVTSILFANLVSKETYGTYQFILAIASTIAVFVPNNMSSAVLRAVARGNEGDLVAATKFQIRWGIIGTIIALGTSLWYVMSNNLGLSLSLIIIAVFMPATYALNTWSAYVQGKKDYKRYFFYNTLGIVISYGGVIAMLFVKKEYLWLAGANIFFAFLANLILYFITIKRMRPGKLTDPETIPYGTHLSIMGIPAGITSPLDALLLFHYLGAAPLAIYSFATILPERLAGGLKFISTIIFPKFSEKNEEDVKNFFKKKIWWLLGFLSIIAGLYALLASYVFQVFFPQYGASIPYTRVYALHFFIIAASVANTALLSQKRTKDLYVSNITTPIVKIILLVTLMFAFGVWGVIWAQIIAIAFQIIFPLYLLHKDRSNQSY